MNTHIPLSKRDFSTYLSVMESIGKNIGRGDPELLNVRIINLEMKPEGLSFIC